MKLNPFLIPGRFRAVRDISVAPIDASDQSQIIRMMDEPEGVLLVRKRKGGGKKKMPEIKPIKEMPEPKSD